jgi:hypothetical protein
VSYIPQAWGNGGHFERHPAEQKYLLLDFTKKTEVYLTVGYWAVSLFSQAYRQNNDNQAFLKYFLQILQNLKFTYGYAKFRDFSESNDLFLGNDNFLGKNFSLRVHCNYFPVTLPVHQLAPLLQSLA